MECILCHKKTSTVLSDTLRDGIKQPVFFCSQCELGILASVPSDSELKKFYASNYRSVGRPKLTSTSNPEEIFSIYTRFQTDRLRLLKPYFSKKKRLLEVGCSAGMFLFHARNSFKEIVGLDYDQASAEFASKKCRCPVYTTDIDMTDLPEKSFDVICAFQTLEHVKDPEVFIAKHAKYLKQNGVMAIEVPNLHDALVHVYDLPYHKQFFYHSAHLWYFTEKSLLTLMKKNGFVGKVYHTQDYNILNHIQWLLNDRPQPDCIPGLSSPVLPFRKTAPRPVQKKLSEFIVHTDLEYKKLLEKFKITSNILFIGRRNEK